MTRNAVDHTRPPAWRRGAGRVVAAILAGVLALSVAGCENLRTPGWWDRADKTAFTQPATREELAEIQRLLSQSGYDPGPIDGLMGPRTEAAIRRYQKDAGLKQDGQASRGLLQHLQSSVAKRETRTTAKRQGAARTQTRAPEIGEAVYDVGDTYAYSDGVSHTVLRVTADRVLWRDSLGNSYTAPRAVALPMIEWANGAWKGHSEARRDTAQPWPPVRGAKVAFDVRAEEWNVEAVDAERMVSETRWTCANEGSRKTSVPAGDFDTVVIACERSPAPAGDWQRRVWYFAPGIAQFVRRDDKDSTGFDLDSVELVATMPGTEGWPPVARAGLKMALQDALSTHAVGEDSVWQSTAISEIFVIRVTGEKKAATGQLCRNYVIIGHGAELRRTYPALACRSAGANNWRTPGFERGLVEIDTRPPARG